MNTNVYSLRPRSMVALLIFLALTCGATVMFAQERTRVLIVVGPSSHPPGTHEVHAGGRVVEYCLEHALNVPGIDAEVVQGWTAKQSLDDIDCVVFTGDRFPLAELPDTEKNMRELGAMMDRGCGIVCFHYATGLTAGQMPDDGNHPLLRWMGGYFATKCVHHQSVAKIFEAATIMPTAIEHPVLRGCKPFTIDDEPYIKNYFGPNGLEENVVALATSMLPPEDPQKEVVAWAIQRPDSGRGMGIVMPHFYKNWQVDELRRMILNGIVWCSKREVPVEGVNVTLPPLEDFQPAAVAPVPRKSR